MHLFPCYQPSLSNSRSCSIERAALNAVTSTHCITFCILFLNFPLGHPQIHCGKLLQSCLTLCNPMDCSPPGSSISGILQARILEWVAMPSSGGSSQPRDQTRVAHISFAGRQVLYRSHHLGSAVSSLRLKATVFLLHHIPT